MNLENVRSQSEEQASNLQENQTAEFSENPSETEEIMIPIKFNKEVKKITIDQAGALAQKGLKFDAIAEDYKTLKALAAQDGKCVSEFLSILQKRQQEDRKKELAEQCGGNEEMAEYVMKLETSGQDHLGFAELQNAFPHIQTISDLPEEVVERAALKGRLLLDEYLRYRLENKKLSDSVAAAQKHADMASIGSLCDRSSGTDPETQEFLKGVWK